MKSLLSITGENKTEYNVSFLPPLVVNFEIPADYPSTSPPLFTLSCKWMTRAQVRTQIILYCATRSTGHVEIFKL